MAKALELSDAILDVAPPIPKASRTSPPVAGGKQRKKAVAKIKREPMQVRWPADEVKAAKVAAIQQDFATVSDFMLACFHAYMKNGKI